MQKDKAGNNKKDLTGQRFGRLVAIKENGRDEQHGNVLWLCQCDCGNTVTVRIDRLTTGNTKSCGCLHKELSSERISKILEDLWENEEFKNKMSGENHPRWNLNLTDEDREIARMRRKGDKEFTEWSKQIKINYNFTCDCCNNKDSGHLVSHHLNSWDNYIEQRYDLKNGVCLCEHCHKEFHKLYGYGNNTKQQYIEFKENKNKGEM